VVSVDKKEAAIIKYIKDYLYCKNIRFHFGMNKVRAKFSFEGERYQAMELIADAILFFYKFKELMSTLKNCSLKNMCFYAYVGALLSIDYAQEKTQIIEEMEKVGKVVSIDGFINFCGYKLIENWKNLAQLAYKLYNQCKNEEDAFELTTFMLGVDGEGEAVIVIDNNSTLRLLKNKSPIPILNIFDREEFNVIATILSHRPTNIIVVNPEKIEPSLMKAIHALGD